VVERRVFVPSKESGSSRREFIKQTGAIAFAASTGMALGSHGVLAQGRRPHNILMIVTDQERYLQPDQLPNGYQLPGHEKLARIRHRFSF
jgi:cysteine synthase